MSKFNNDILIHKIENGTEVIQFKKLLEFPNLKHCYTLRKNDIDINIVDPKNKERLEKSYKKIANLLDMNKESIVQPIQTHTDNIEYVDNNTDKIKDVDGLITNKKDILLCTTSADCISLLFYDDNKKIIADIHSGWRGTLKKIGKKAAEKMIKNYGSNPKDIICCICPSIRKCHFEVDEDVMELFKNEFEYTGRINEIISVGKIVDGKQKYNIDTALINRIILEEVGLLEENIVDSNICTVCNADSFHSYRVDKENSGRNGAFIGMI